MSFASLNLHPKILSAIVETGYTTPTPIQQQAIPVILAGGDLIASAQTGTGKTAAFVLPTLDKIARHADLGGKLKVGSGKPKILILTPTRELSQQVTTAASQYGKDMRFNAVSIVGGMSYRQQQRSLSRTVDMLIATPGRLIDWMGKPHVLDLSQVETLILDEADRMLDMGFIEDVEHIVRHIGKATKYQKRQTLLFSATVDERISKLARNILDNPAMIQITPTKATHANIEQRLYVVNDTAHKDKLLDHLLESEPIEQVILFCSTKAGAEKYADRLRRRGHAAGALHGDLKQNQRMRILEELRDGRIQILVATDVAARGIDVRGISHVFNYDVPKFSEDYVHRIGRTGRAGQKGIAISFVLSSEGRFVQGIERYTGHTLKQFTVPGMEATYGLNQRSAPGKKKSFGGRKFQGKGSGRPANGQSRFKSQQPVSESQAYFKSKEAAVGGQRAAKPRVKSPDGRSRFKPHSPAGAAVGQFKKKRPSEGKSFKD